ncbi:DUF1631 family protein [Cognatilysobacter segetis]|uniref:DUF1631 family protein n=1 Tax=Cognatilysobacter segetis TaxID=2492394 RepID=UPI00105BDB4E|nr:DUF1631 family protein [Lysobacter segetis]
MSVPFPPNRRVPPATALAAAALPRRVRETLEAVHALAYEVVVDPFDRVIPQLEARLVHLRDQGARHAVGVSYLEQSQLLARRQSGFVIEFARAIDAELAGLRTTARMPQRSPEAPSMPSFGELRLVDEDETDEVSEVKAIALRHESRASLPIHLLCQRFAVLAEAPAFEPGRLPVGPQRLCELMLAAAEANGFSLALRIALLREFDRTVLGEYPGIAESLNDLLARLRIMPGLSFVPLRPRARIATAESATPDAERPHTGWTSTAPTDADTPTFQMLQDLLASRRSAADRFRGGGFGAGSGSGTGSAAGVGTGTGTGAGGAEAGSPGAALQLSLARPELPTRVALELLRDAGDDVRGLDIEAIRQWLLLQGRHRTGEAVALSQTDADVFELLGLMYAQLQRDVRRDSAAVAMLSALPLPLLRLALGDSAFFLNAGHPGREILNAVAEAGARWQAADDVDPQWLLQLERIVDTIARARDDLGDAFRAGATTLEQQQQAVARRADIAERRNIESARGKDKLAVARHVAGAVIEDALTTTRVPAFHRGMLRHAWADVLTLAHLRNGESSAEWAALVDATGELVRAAAGAGEAGPDLVLLVDQWLVTVGYHADDAARIARILTGTDGDQGDDAATRTELAMRLKSRARLGEEATGDGAASTTLDAAGEAEADRVRGLPPGTWIEMRDERGEALRRRLSWLSPTTGAALLVNARGQRIGESTVNALARDLVAGRARIVTAGEGRLVDRAWRAALASLASNAGRTE